jgi:hypothetical protein
MYRESTEREGKMQDQIKPLVAEMLKLRETPAPGPPGQVSPPPPATEQQKGGLSEFIFNLLKFGALTAVAFGIGGRGYGHNAAWKGAIGAALKGYASGRKDVADGAMKVWEKNREIINDANREQNANYRAILQDQRLALTQKMDMINGLSKMYQDTRMYDASRLQDLKATIKALDDQIKVQRDKEKWEIEHRDKIYDVLGKNQLTAQYLAWLSQQSGGKVNLTGNSNPDDWHKVEKEHPEWAFSEFLKWHEQEEIRKAGEKTKRETEERLKAKKAGEEGGETTPADPEAAKKAAKILEGLVQ